MEPELKGREDVVEAFIKEKKMDAEVIRFAKPVRTVEDVEKLGIPSESVVKTLIGQKEDGKYVAVLARGDKRLDLKKLSRVLGKKVKLASPREVEELTHVGVGSVSPLMPFVEKVNVVIDKHVFELSEAYAGGGSAKALVRFNPQEYAEKTNALIADVCK